MNVVGIVAVQLVYLNCILVCSFYIQDIVSDLCIQVTIPNDRTT